VYFQDRLKRVGGDVMKTTHRGSGIIVFIAMLVFCFGQLYSPKAESSNNIQYAADGNIFFEIRSIQRLDKKEIPIDPEELQKQHEADQQILKEIKERREKGEVPVTQREASKS